MVQETSLCGLGQSAPNPLLSTLRYFPQEYEELLADRAEPVHDQQLHTRIELESQ